jgi:hypothetical protein
MSEPHLNRFPGGVLALPFEIEALLAGWSRLRSVMVKNIPEEAFSRDEWAYLVAFVDGDNLRAAFAQAFGASPKKWLWRPRGTVAVWLPSNVSLLGPLTLILTSLSGNALRLKEGSESQNLTRAFLEFLRQHVKPGDGPLHEILHQRITLETFDRLDPRNQEMAREAKVRIVFGSDEAAAAIEALPHPIDSVGFAFSDRRSEAWIEPAGVEDRALLGQLIKVFAIYGQAGCTSPRRVVIIGGEPALARRLRDQLVALWPEVIPRRPAVHVASASLLGYQLARADGLEPVLTAERSALLAITAVESPELVGPQSLALCHADTVEQAMANLPDNIQTLGHAFANVDDERWLKMLARTRVKRLVPIARMHHFGATWDGWAYFRQLFEEVEVA